MTSILRQRLLSTRTLLLLRCWPNLRAQPHRLYNRGKQEDRTNVNTSLVHIDDKFDSIPVESRNKQTFLNAISEFKKMSKYDRGYVEFIYSATKHMQEYGLHKDIEVYKALIELFPVGPLVAKNVWQKMFLHYPNQQFCCIKLLDAMEWNLVYPDMEIFHLVKARFGPWSMTTKKVRRMLYWYPRLRYTNKYLDRSLQDQRHQPLSFVQLAKKGLEMMSRDKGNIITYTKVADDKSLIVSAQSPLQRRLISSYDPKKTCYYVDGPFLLYVAENPLKYVTFNTDPGPNSERLLDRFVTHAEIEDVYAKKFYNGPWEEEEPENGTVHEQVDQTILGMAALERNTENAASAWINHLQSMNPALKNSTVILRIGQPSIRQPE